MHNISLEMFGFILILIIIVDKVKLSDRLQNRKQLYFVKGIEQHQNFAIKIH